MDKDALHSWIRSATIQPTTTMQNAYFSPQKWQAHHCSLVLIRIWLHRCVLCSEWASEWVLLNFLYFKICFMVHFETRPPREILITFAFLQNRILKFKPYVYLILYGNGPPAEKWNNGLSTISNAVNVYLERKPVKILCQLGVKRRNKILVFEIIH